jgi:hypothetical protein
MDAMNILFVTMAALRQGPSGLTSDIASTRYRVLIPARQLSRLGHTVQLASLPPGAALPDAVKNAACDVIVFSKSFTPVHEELAAAMRSRGVKVIADSCDDHFDDPEKGPRIRRMLEIAEVATASTPAMADAIRAKTGRDAIVITDPVEGMRGEPKFSPRLPALRIAWFGHPSNLPAMVAREGELHALAARMEIDLTVVSEPGPLSLQVVGELGARGAGRVRVHFVPWSLEATAAALAQCDLVWIPVDASGQKAVKSPNRLVESVWAGRLVVADSIPSYQPFADLVPVGVGLESAVTRALENPAKVEDDLREAQQRVASVHSALECGRQWARAIGDTAPRPVRLNLGCGDKILPGYVNVDVVEARAGMRPDVVCDLHRLTPFEDASADEILSVHVVEHFWRWEIRDVLREWVRVLRPGGRMIVECPNIQSACQTFLENPAQYSREDQDGQRTMWVFYGDPAWKDPLMIHRWGYTPESLKALLGEVGLKDVRQEPAQFKLREPRDMRIVGNKPG